MRQPQQNTDDTRAGPGRATAPKRVTMRDVAKAAGVSVQTVSNVVNGRSRRTTQETEHRVRALLEELKFLPNVAARSLRSARTRTISFVVLDAAPHFLGDPMTDQFLAGLGDEVRERSHGLLISAARPGVGVESLVQPLVEGRADAGIFLLSGDRALRATYLEGLRGLSQPYALLQEHGAPGEEMPSICAEDRRGSRDLCQHLIRQGHERIGFLTAARSWSAIEERIDGYRDAHVEAGLVVDEVLVVTTGEFTPLDAAVAAGDLLDRHPRPTAIMCGNDLVALGVAKAARDRRLTVPTDLAITGFDDFDFARALDPPLTTVRIPGYEMGLHAAAALIDAVQLGKGVDGRSFATELFLRGSA